MKRLAAVFCFFGLAGCQGDDSSFEVAELLKEPASSESVDVGERWLRSILSTMQGKTGQYLISAAQEHAITIAYADDLQHRIGEFDPSRNAITLELPLGIETATPEQFEQMVLTGRRVMYEELDHGVRDHERERITGLSAEYSVDGFHTSNEAIARITAYIGMSEDAQIGSAPDFSIQLGMPDNGHAIYFGTTDVEMADVIISGLESDSYFHESPELINDAFAAFYGTSTSEWYALYYASSIIPDSFIEKYDQNVSLAQLLNDYSEGNPLKFDDFARFANLITESDQILLGSMRAQFESGEFTAEAERLTLNDLIRARNRFSQPDGGRANHLDRTASGGNFFRDAPPERLAEAFDILINDAEVIQQFMASCMNKDYLSEDARRVARNNHDVISEYMPVLIKGVGVVKSILGGSELDAPTRIELETIYRSLESVLVVPSENRVAIHESYVAERRDDGVRLCP